MTDFQENPRAALSKGWSLLSAVVAGASKVVNENVIQPGIERATDPSLHATVLEYMSEAQKKAVVAGSTANQWSKQQFGVDVAGSVGNVVGTVRDTVGPGPSRMGYGSLAQEHDGERSALYGDDEEDEDFFQEFSSAPAQSNQQAGWTNAPAAAAKQAAPAPKQDSWDDDWKDF